MDENNYFEKRKIETYDKLENLLDDLPYFCREFFIGIENSTSPLTRLNYAYDLRIFFDFLFKKVPYFKKRNVDELVITDLNNVSVTDLEYFMSYLNNYTFKGNHYTNSEKAKLRKISTVRSFFKYFFNKEKLISNVASKVITPKLHDKEIIRLEVNEVAKMINEAVTGDNFQSKRAKSYHNITAVRDTAILTLFLGTGIRISELVGLNIEDIDFNNNAFVVTRKGGNKTILYFSDEVASYLKAYMEERLEEQTSDRALFLSIQKKRISVRALEILVKKYAKLIVPLKKITPHKLRSTYGTNLYRETGDIYIVAEVLGHKDINTTKKHYAATSDELKRLAASKVKLVDD